MVRGAAGHDKHLAQILDLLLCQGDVVQHDFPAPDTGGDGLPKSLGLLADFLHHEVLVAALFRRGDIPLDALRFLLDGLQLLVVEVDGVPGENGNLLVLQPVDVPGAGEDGRHVAGDIVLPFPDADDQGAVLPHGENAVRAVGADDAQRVAALHLGDDFLNGLQHVAFVVVFQHLGHHFRVGVGDELHAPADEMVFQVQVILDDAVVHHGEQATVADLGMGIDVGRGPMGGPPGVTDAHSAGQLFAALEDAVQHAQTPLGLYHVDAGVVVHCHARRVIAPVLQFLQAVEQNGRRLLLADISYNAAHDNQSFLFQ